jgi:hypothetical protein
MEDSIPGANRQASSAKGRGSRQITPQIHRFLFVDMPTLASGYRNTGMTIKIILLIFSPVIHQEIFLFRQQR